MSCRSIQYKMDDLRRCGCGRCRDEYYRLERDMYDRRYYEPPRITGMDYGSAVAKVTAQLTSKVEIKMEKVEEPKNIAVKILVDKLKAEQSTLTSAKSSLETYKTYIKTYSDNKTKAEKNIKELSGALKKLGHKEA